MQTLDAPNLLCIRASAVLQSELPDHYRGPILQEFRERIPGYALALADSIPSLRFISLYAISRYQRNKFNELSMPEKWRWYKIVRSSGSSPNLVRLSPAAGLHTWESFLKTDKANATQLCSTYAQLPVNLPNPF